MANARLAIALLFDLTDGRTWNFVGRGGLYGRVYTT